MCTLSICMDIVAIQCATTDALISLNHSRQSTREINICDEIKKTMHSRLSLVPMDSPLNKRRGQTAVPQSQGPRASTCTI